MAAELVADKLPATPPRTAAPGLVPRAILGALAAAGQAHRDGRAVLLAGGVGLGAALAVTAAGGPTRSAAARAFGSDLPGALIEDALAVLLGVLAARAVPDPAGPVLRPGTLLPPPMLVPPPSPPSYRDGE